MDSRRIHWPAVSVGSLLALLALPGAVTAQQHGAVCAAVAALVVDSVSSPRITRDTVIEDPRTREALRGCALTLRGRQRAYATGTRPEDRVRDGLLALGWREHLHYAADGPDGTAFALWRGTATCFVEASWDGGDDADPAYVPQDDYVLKIGCVTGE